MYFTQEDFKKIEKWLLQSTVKDTQFADAATPLKGNETIAFVQGNQNVKTTIKDFVDQLFLLGVADFLNVTDKYGEKYLSIEQAIQLIPPRSRKIGQVITFMDTYGNWVIYQFQGQTLNQWNNTTMWINVISSIIVSETVPDEEDLTGIKQNNKLFLKFKNKDYSTNDFSGLGRIYLRKNIRGIADPVEGTITANVLTQQMVRYPYTIYHLQYDYNLNGETIIIPEGCVILFEGGSVNNGILVFRDTILINQYKGTATIQGSYIYQDAIADGEDITLGSVLKFSDKEYQADNYSGLGRVYLRKNIINGVNVLLQSMINKENTIYHIQYNYDLVGATITIPDNCVLLFDGGSFKNGELYATNTLISNHNDAIFDNVTLSGKLLNTTAYSNWFNFDTTGVQDNTKYAQNLFSYPFERVIFSEGIYKISDITIPSNIIIEGNNTTIQAVIKYPGLSSVHKSVFSADNKDSITIKNINFTGDTSIKWTNKYEGESLIKCINVTNVSIQNCKFYNTTGYCSNDEMLYEGQLITCRDCNNINISSCEFYQHVKTEHIWITTYKNDRSTCNVQFTDNYIHDLLPINNIVGNTILNSICNDLYIERNTFQNCTYVGSLLNAFGLNTVFKDNTVKQCSMTSVIDNCEYGNFRGDRFIAEGNHIDCKNSIAFLVIADVISIKNNICKCTTALHCLNATGISNHKDGYTTPAPAATLVEVYSNIFDLTNYQSGLALSASPYNNGIFIVPQYYQGDSVFIKNNKLTIRSISSIDKKNRQPLYIGNCKHIYVENNEIDSDVKAYASDSASAFLLYQFLNSVQVPINFKEVTNLVVTNNTITTPLRAFILATTTYNIDNFIFDEVIFSGNQSVGGKGLYLSVNNGYIKNLFNLQDMNNTLHLDDIEYAPIVNVEGKTENCNARNLGRLREGATYLLDKQIVHVVEDCCIPKYNLSEATGTTLRAGTIVRFDGQANMMCLKGVSLDGTEPPIVTDLPYLGIIEYLGVYWLKVYSGGPYIVSSGVGNSNQIPQLSSALKGYMYYNTTTNQWITWDGEVWRNYDATVVDNVIII